MTTPALAAFGVGILCAAGLIAFRFALDPPDLFSRRDRSPRDRYSIALRVVVGALVAAVVVVFVTGSAVLGIAAAVLVIAWRGLFAAGEANRDRQRITAIQKWLSDLRDTVNRSSVAIEPALELVAEETTGLFEAPMRQYALRRRQGVPIPEALQELADSIDHPTADAAVAAVTLVVTGGAGGGELSGTLDQLSAAARDELNARSAIDRLRRTYERSMKRLVWLTVGFIALLVAVAPDMMAAYRTETGQLWLIVPIAVWVGCLLWLRSLAGYGSEPRNRLRLEEIR